MLMALSLSLSFSFAPLQYTNESRDVWRFDFRDSKFSSSNVTNAKCRKFRETDYSAQRARQRCGKEKQRFPLTLGLESLRAYSEYNIQRIIARKNTLRKLMRIKKL